MNSHDWVVHFAAGCLFAGSGFLLRGACEHRGWLPHPVHQLSLAAGMVALEATAVMGTVG